MVNLGRFLGAIGAIFRASGTEHEYIHSEKEAIDRLNALRNKKWEWDDFWVVNDAGDSLYIAGDSEMLGVSYQTPNGKVYDLVGDCTEGRVLTIINVMFSASQNVLKADEWAQQ